MENKFVNILSTVFYAHYHKQAVEVKKRKTTKIFKIKTVSKEIEYPGLKNAEEELNHFRETELCNYIESVNFLSMWQFCQFIRFAEKVFFYHNDIDKCFYVDSEMNDLVKRDFKITDLDNKVDIIVSMEKKKETLSDDTLNVLRISVKRNYGKQMINEFTIVNDFVKTKDDSDKLLIEIVYSIIFQKMKEQFDSIIQLVSDIGDKMNMEETL